ncbi:MAG TPA: hypothetical protein VGS41_17070, partial [Chthonomonadales bacterium]|nr:hypothetical protein [Chthonomonadales bacterium]
VRMRELLYFVAELLHAPKPRRAPAVLAKMLVGEISFSVFSSSYRISNRKARDLLGFKPTFPSYRESWNNIVAEAAA